MKIFIAASIASAITSFALAQPIDTIEKVKASGSITMGVRDASGALSYSLGNGKYGGYHVEICQIIAIDIEKAIGKKIEIAYQTVTPQDRIRLLNNGTIDIECGTTTNNATRQKDMAFLNTVYMEQVRIAVKEKSDINSISQLNGKNVATTANTTSIQLLRKHERATGLDFVEVLGKDHAESFGFLESGRADAFVMDATTLIGHIVNSKSPGDYRIVGEVLSLEPLGIMIRKDDPNLLKLGNDVIAKLVKTGDIAKIYDKWFMQPIPPKGIRVNMPATEETKAAWANLSSNPAEAFAKK